MSCSESTLSRFRFIVIELHGVDQLIDPNITLNVLHPLYMKLAKNFVCVHAHPNNCCGETVLPDFGINLPALTEFTFYRKDRLPDASPSDDSRVLIPHPLDISRNVPTLAPIVLNEHWFEGPRPLLSQIKMLTDEVEWLRTDLDRRARESRETLTTVVGYLSPVDKGAELSESEPGSGRLEEVAEGRPFQLGKGYSSANQAGTVHENESFFFHTALGFNQYITIDLESPKIIRRLEIRNRLDGFSDRAQILFSIYHDNSDIPETGAQFLDPPEEFLNGSELEFAIKVAGCTARFVTLFSPANTALHFSRVRIYADRTS